MQNYSFRMSLFKHKLFYHIQLSKTGNFIGKTALLIAFNNISNTFKTRNLVNNNLILHLLPNVFLESEMKNEIDYLFKIKYKNNKISSKKTLISVNVSSIILIKSVVIKFITLTIFTTLISTFLYLPLFFIGQMNLSHKKVDFQHPTKGFVPMPAEEIVEEIIKSQTQPSLPSPPVNLQITE